MAHANLAALVAAELAEPVAPEVLALAQAVAARHSGSCAVLFYGSALRAERLDGLMLDFYLIVAAYPAAYPQGWLATANRLLPPNVFPIEAGGLAAKYAVLSEAAFVHLCGPEARDVSVWARFAQPARLVWAADAAAMDTAAAAIALAAPTLLARARPLLGRDPDPLDIWREGFARTYACELRAERSDRPGSIVDFDPDRYRRFSAPALAAAGLRLDGSPTPVERRVALARWRRFQRRGKLLTLARLAKASLTFGGGLDYLAWKINRHAGTAIVIRPWQRRWPILGAISLLPRLVARGAVR